MCARARGAGMSAEPAWLAATDPPAWPAPAWLAQVPTPRARDGEALSERARLHLCAALERGGEPLAPFVDWLDPGSLREHAWALVEAWAAHGADPRERWVLAGLRVVSDDELEERLLPDRPSADGARAVFDEQRARLERALSTGRAFSLADFAHQLVDHPLLRPLVRGLVWVAIEEGGARTAFLVEDDGRFTGVMQEDLRISTRARIALAHPIELGEAALAAWGDRLAEAELVQPFPQLARAIVRPADVAGDTLVAVPRGALPAADLARELEARGWVRGEPDERVRVRCFHKAFVAAGVHAVLVVEPGLAPRDPAPQAPREAFFLRRAPGGVTFAAEPRIPLAEVSPIALSEVLHDLGALP